MYTRSAAFYRPNLITVLVFLVLTLIIPVAFVYIEPERTNYLPGEQEHWDIKSKYYNGVLDEIFFDTEGNLDVSIGILYRDYVTNILGIPLLVIYYSIASGLKTTLHKIYPGNIAT